ncbi:hypothetical protein [Variovorax ginsengisoli]|uniref:Uncharacterized protein n=1 Tax=Variovorax ginsengisoli TaxID=363844 RepID=A0ABT9S5N7_9BURK|nr:hypothetical protein [Variovorax ginsengisoli]MDP9899682.1 hypothetical protein [Variovorax ginsengisoli]
MALFDRWLGNRFFCRVLHKVAFGAVMLLCTALSVLSSVSRPVASAQAAAFQEWPSTWDGALLRPLALSEVEHRFAVNFPGRIARLTDGERLFVMREVLAPTRMLHPAPDCYRALGYRIEGTRLERDAQARLWRCFTAARKQGQTLRVCERIVDADGTAFTDTSAWYWAAASGRSPGPWHAVTVARPM